MAGNRREFLKTALAFAAVLSVPASKDWKAAEARIVRAVRPKRYPGCVVPLRPESVAKRADWAG